MEIVYRTAIQSSEDPLEYVMSDETIDRMGDQISVAGWQLSSFRQNPIALFNHDKDAPIGSWASVRVEGGKLIAKLKLAAQGTSRLVDTVRSLVDQRILRACSVGFKPLEREPLTKDADPYFGPFKFLKAELVECSLVSVPANPNALQVSKAIGLTPPEINLVFCEPANENRHERRGVVRGKPAIASPKKGTPMKLSKKIETQQAHISRLRDRLTELSDNDEPTDDELQLLEQLPDEIETAMKDLERMQKVERALAVQQSDNDDGGNHNVIERSNNRHHDNPEIIPPNRPFRLPAKKLEPHDFFIRAAVCAALTKITQIPIDVIRKARYGEDESTAWMVRAVTNPALTSVPGWAQELVQTATAAFLERLAPDTIYPKLRARGSSFTFGPGAGTIRVPGRTATPQLAGAWVGEGQPIPVRRLGLTSVMLTPKKLAVISTFSHELADYSTPNIEGVIRDAMNEDTALVIDTNLLDDQAATTVRPAGLRSGVAALTPSAATDLTDAMIADIKALVGAIIAVNGGRDIVIITNSLQEMGINFARSPAGFLFPNEGEAGRRFNVSFISSNTVPPGMVIAVDAAEFATASGDVPEFNVSDQATIHEEDTLPLAINGGTPATPVRSLWQTDTIGVRMRMPLNWTMRRPGMVAWMDDVLW